MAITTLHWWISPRGEEIRVSNHALYVYDHPKKFDLTRKRIEREMDKHYVYGQWFDTFEGKIFLSGWIRVYNFGTGIDFNVGIRNKKNLDRVMEFLASHQEELGGIKEIVIISERPDIRKSYSVKSLSSFFSSDSVYEKKK